jgi:hypothetical protein
MASDVSFMQYMRAHGNTPGPTQRPHLTGAIGGFIAAFPSGALLYWSGALAGAAASAGVGLWAAAVSDAIFAVLAGMLYAAIFKRAANDREGGWLFGISYGFLLWTLLPLTLWQSMTANPTITGRAAMGLFAGQVFYGLVLGFVYPWVHGLVQSRLGGSQMAGDSKSQQDEASKTKGN